MITLRKSAAVVAMAVMVAACGGGDDSASDLFGDEGGDDVDENVFDDVGDAAEQFERGDASFEVLEAPTVTADPGTAVIEVDGQRLDYPMAGAIHLTCDVSPESVQINIQTPEGYSMSMIASTITGSWTGSLTAVGDDTNVAYGSGFGGGRVGIGDDAVSYEGPIDKVVDRDITNPEVLDGAVAVNCATPGGEPTATVDDQTYTFPVSGAQSFDCEVAADAFEIRVNRLAIDDLQLEMQGRNDGAQWVGAVVVYTSEGNWTGPLPPDGAGLSIEGGTVTFDGTFAGPDGTEVQGSATATCF
jgi:hypothetical protein